jgi:putative colanic acid biosysnthesis UDP-glucose lipid carrier transferase
MSGVVSNHVIRYQRIEGNLENVNSKSEKSLYLAGKRVFDFLVSLLVICFVLSWLIPILAILIKLDSQGPVFFMQQRVGFMGRIFPCLKLRTMVVNEDSDSMQARENDPRITKLGRFLRFTSLDEFPQFFNVLKGEMSIVGPRPFMKSDDENFNQVVSNYELRYFAKPGITGIAQVKGYRGPAVSFYSIFHRYQWDAFYIRNASLSLDFKILRLTCRQTIKSIIYFKNKKQDRLSMVEANFLLDNLQ